MKPIPAPRSHEGALLAKHIPEETKVKSRALSQNRTIAVMQTIGAVLVVLRHVVADSELLLQINWIFEFRMPLFMFISGYLLKYGSAGYMSDMGGFVRKKIERLLVPYVVISTLAVVPKSLFGGFFGRTSYLSLGSWLHGLIVPADNPIMTYWFLPTVFIIMVTAALALRATRRQWVISVFMAVSLCATLFDLHTTRILNLEGVKFYYLWWGAGFYFCMWQEQIVRFLRLGKGWVCLVLLGIVLSGFAWPISFWVKTSVGILLCFSVGLLYESTKQRFLDHLFGYSFTIYLLSWAVQGALVKLSGSLSAIVPVAWALSLAAGVYVPWLIARFVKRRWPDAKFPRLVVGI